MKKNTPVYSFYTAFRSTLGLDADPRDLTFSQVALRGLMVFVVAVIMVRLGDKRFLSKKTAFDAILGFILASMLARAVNGSAPFFPTLGGGFILVGLHRLVGLIARHSHIFGTLVKGSSDLVIKDGQIQERAMRKNHLSKNDVLEDLRLSGHVENPAEVKIAYVERNGQISVIPRKEKS